MQSLEHIRAALLCPLGVDGVYGRTALYEQIIDRLNAYISRQREPEAEILRLPPVMSRAQLEKSGYLKSFPNLLGCVCALHGSESKIRAAADAHEHGGSWTDSLSASDLVLLPAACYPVYPLVAERGPLPAGGLLFDVAADCFRHEPSKALNRLQSFRMRELVRIGAPEEVMRFREYWKRQAMELAGELHLPALMEVASDPFFGRVGQVMKVHMLHNALKFELLVPYLPPAPDPASWRHPDALLTACMSFNYHQDHFGSEWCIEDRGGKTAHTGCVAFGMDRLAVALFCTHGLDLAGWPAPVRQALRM
jgi:seryl-tRNA synthetase